MPAELHHYAWLVCALASGVLAVLTWRLLRAVEHGARQLARLERLDELANEVRKLAAEREGLLDLRRVEHVLLDMRDGQRRVEERMLALVEARAQSSPAAGGALLRGSSAPAAGLAEEVVARLLALGYQRVQIVTPFAELESIALEGGQVVIEARRDGAPCKGRVTIAQGAIQDVALQSAYSAFP